MDSLTNPKKRKGAIPSLLRNDLLSCSSVKKFLVISSLNKKAKVAEKSPFKIHKALCNILIGEAHSVTKLGSGDILVELHDSEQVDRLRKCKSFDDVPVSVQEHKSLNSSRGVVRDRDFRNATEEEFAEQCVGVTRAQRIFRRKGDDKVPTDSFILTFSAVKPPQSVKAAYKTLEVRPFVPRPMRCFKCHRFGHGKDRCRKETSACARCGKGGHAEQGCSNAPTCINCRGEHSASSKDCPKFLEEQAILRYRAVNGGTFQQARKATLVPVAKTVSSRSYASAAKTGAVTAENKQSAANQDNRQEQITRSSTVKKAAVDAKSASSAVEPNLDKTKIHKRTARATAKKQDNASPIITQNRFSALGEMEVDPDADLASVWNFATSLPFPQSSMEDFPLPSSLPSSHPNSPQSSPAKPPDKGAAGDFSVREANASQRNYPFTPVVNVITGVKENKSDQVDHLSSDQPDPNKL